MERSSEEMNPIDERPILPNEYARVIAAIRTGLAGNREAIFVREAFIKLLEYEKTAKSGSTQNTES
jgi:hypothetical protein